MRDSTAPVSRFAFRRRSVLLAAVGVFIAVLFWRFATPAGGGVQVAWTVDTLTDVAFVALWLAAAAGYGGRVGRGLLDDDPAVDPSLRTVTAIALGVGVIGFATLALGLIGVLNRGTAWALLAGGLACLPWSRRIQLRDWLNARSSTIVWTLPLAAIATILVSWASLPPGFLWKPLDPHPYDVVSYHLQIPREWYELGRIVPLPHNSFSYFPAGQEVHSLLAMHALGGPWAAMYVAQLIPVALTLLTGLAVVGYARPRVGGAAWPIGLSVLAVPWTLMLGSVAYVESGVTLYATLAVIWACRPPAVRSATIAGVFLGLAGGIKYTALAMTAVPLLVLWPVIALVQARGGVTSVTLSSGPRDNPHPDRVTEVTPPPRLSRPVLASWLAMALVCGLTVAPWFVRNAVWAHDPVFPLLSQTFGHTPFTADQADRYAAAHSPPPAERSIVARLNAGWHRVVIDWQYGYVWVPLAVVGLALAWRGGLAGRLTGAMLIATTLVWLLATHDEPRFLAPAVPLVGMLLAGLPRRRWLAVPMGVALVAWTIAGVFETDAAAEPHLANGRQGLFRASDLTPLLQPEVKDALDHGGKLALVGDAQAFFYPFPVGRLKYRGVFDVVVPPGTSLVDGWLREPVDRLRAEGWTVLIAPGELSRLAGTYRNLPQPQPPYADPAMPPIVLPPTGENP